MKCCSRCKETLPVKNFNKNTLEHDGLQEWCSNCRHKHYLKTKEKYKEARNQANRELIWRRAVQVMYFYSKGRMCCELCGIDNMDLLTIDHIKGNGNQQRIQLFGSKWKAGKTMYLWLIKNNFPSGYRVLCRNCNWKEYLRVNHSGK